MLDTVKLRSPALTEREARAVEQLLQRRTCVDLRTGELLWEFTSGPLLGTWDHRMSLRVERQEWVKLPHRAQPVLEPCQPFLVLEGSIHKALLGHNVYGGPRDVYGPVRWFVDQLGHGLGVELPDGADWVCRRIDWAHVYDLGSVEAVQEFVSYLHNARFPRRKVGRYDDESIMVSGTTTSVKLYHKGPEFQKHDRGRVARFGDAEALQARANMLLRTEVEIHARTLDDEYPDSPAAGLVSVQWIDDLHNRDMGRLMREGACYMGTVRTAAAVKRRLYEVYSPARASALWGTWLELSALGERSARQRLKRTTFYRHRQELQRAGCSWHDSDVKLDPRLRLVPEDFTPLPHDPRCADVEAPEVVAALAPYRRTA